LDVISATNNLIYVTGFRDGGGTIHATFVTDSIPSDGTGANVDFETFVFGPGCTNPVALHFTTPSVNGERMGYDNIVVNVVPEPSTALLLASGLVGIAGQRRDKLRNCCVR
jgi:hypothetical protein